MITMLLGGLWHGANWTFVVWGALHGVYLWVEKFIQDIRSAKQPQQQHTGVMVQTTPKTFSNFSIALFTFFLVNVTWVFFRATDFTSAWRLLTSMFYVVPKAAVILTTLSIIKVSAITVCMVAAHWMMRNTSVLTVAAKLPWWLLGFVWAIMLLLLIWSQESSSSFIYFQF